METPLPSPESYGGLINSNDPSVHSVAPSKYSTAQQSSDYSNLSSPELDNTAMPSPLDLNRSVLNVKRGQPILHSASTSSLGNPKIRSQMVEPEYHVQSVLAGLEKMLAQSGEKMFQLNDPLITYMRFMLKPHDPEVKAAGRFAQMKAKLVPKRTPDISAPVNLRNAYQQGSSGQDRSVVSIYDPTIESVRKLFPRELTDVLRALMAIAISVLYLDKLPRTDPDSPLSWPELQVSLETKKPCDPVGFENAPAKARAMLGMDKGMKGLVLRRSSSEVFGERANGVQAKNGVQSANGAQSQKDTQPKGRDRVETIQLGMKALAKHMIMESVGKPSDDLAERLFAGVNEIVKLGEGYD